MLNGLITLNNPLYDQVKALTKGILILDKFRSSDKTNYLILKKYETTFNPLLSNADLLIMHLAKIGNSMLSNILARSVRHADNFLSTLPDQTASALSEEMSSKDPLIKWMAYRVVAHTAQYADRTSQVIEMLTTALQILPEEYHLNVHECLSNVQTSASWADATYLSIKLVSLYELIAKGSARQKSQAAFRLANVCQYSQQESRFYNPHRALAILQSFQPEGEYNYDTTYRDAALLNIALLKLNGPADLKNSEEGISILERIRASKTSMRPEIARRAGIDLLRIYACTESLKTKVPQLASDLFTDYLPEHMQKEVNSLREQASK